MKVIKYFLKKVQTPLREKNLTNKTDKSGMIICFPKGFAAQFSFHLMYESIYKNVSLER